MRDLSLPLPWSTSFEPRKECMPAHVRGERESMRVGGILRRLQVLLTKDVGGEEAEKKRKKRESGAEPEKSSNAIPKEHFILLYEQRRQGLFCIRHRKPNHMPSGPASRYPQITTSTNAGTTKDCASLYTRGRTKHTKGSQKNGHILTHTHTYTSARAHTPRLPSGLGRGLLRNL